MEYRERAIDPHIARLLGELPALLIVGPRASGKTTTALRHAASVARLDRPAEAEAFLADPDSALRSFAEPVLLDEWQAVPEVLGAVKRAVDGDFRPGRFLLTGSVRADLEAKTWPGTGRVVRVPLLGMTVAEQGGRPAPAPLFDRVVRGDELSVPAETPDLRGYVELALRSGFPEAALSRSDATRREWIESYIDQLVTRDAMDLEPRRDPSRLRRFFEAYALNSAGVVSDTALREAVGINHRTAVAYERLLLNLLVVERLPAWASNRLKRLARSPKRYMIDPALIAGILHLDAAAVMRDGNLLGRVLDTFVVAQLRAGLFVSDTRPRLYHLRQEEGRQEIDLIAEFGAGNVIAIEIKTGGARTRDAAKHLVWLRDRLGDRFVAGVVLHTGPRVFPIDDRIVAAPICTLWA